MYVIYIDMLFCINWIMDFFIFYTSLLILNRKISWKQLIIITTFSAIMACMVVVSPVLQRIPTWIYAIGTSIIPISYLTKPLVIKDLFRPFIVFHGVAFLLGGAIFNIWTLFYDYYSITCVSILLLITIALLCTSLIYFSFEQIRQRCILPLFEYEMDIFHDKQCIRLKSLLDTGNCLYTPITHKAVIVSTYEALKPILTPQQLAFLSKKKQVLTKELFSDMPFEPCYIIPFHSVGCSEDILFGIEVEKVVIRRATLETCIEKCVIGIASEPLFRTSTYQALLHPDYIT